jgi:hypothetical protein
MIALKKIAARAALAGALGLSALGTGVGIAYADPGHGHGHGHDDWGRWDGPGPGYWNPIDACVSATGPFGYVTASVCI